MVSCSRFESTSGNDVNAGQQWHTDISRRHSNDPWHIQLPIDGNRSEWANSYVQLFTRHQRAGSQPWLSPDRSGRQLVLSYIRTFGWYCSIQLESEAIFRYATWAESQFDGCALGDPIAF